MWVVTRDGDILERLTTKDKAFMWLIDHQGQSVHYALTHGGYEIREGTDDEALPTKEGQ